MGDNRKLRPDVITKQQLVNSGYIRMFYSNHTNKMSVQIVKYIKSELDGYKLINRWNVLSLEMKANYKYVVDQFDSNEDLKHRVRIGINDNLTNYMVERCDCGISYAEPCKDYYAYEYLPVIQ